MITIKNHTRDTIMRLLAWLIVMCDKYEAQEGYTLPKNKRRQAAIVMKELRSRQSTDGRRGRKHEDQA